MDIAKARAQVLKAISSLRANKNLTLLRLSCQTFRYVAISGFGLVAILVVGSMIPVQQPHAGQADCSITVYVSNIENFHSEIIVPVHNSVFDWRSHLPLAQYFQNSDQLTFLSFGWGDELFFRTESRDLYTISQALFWPTSSVLHVSGRLTAPRNNTSSVAYRAVQISRAEYLNLAQDLQHSFALTPQEDLQLIEPGLVRNSYFFQAKDAYHLFNTCNHWTAKVLKRADIQTPLIPLFPQTIVRLAASDCSIAQPTALEDREHP